MHGESRLSSLDGVGSVARRGVCVCVCACVCVVCRWLKPSRLPAGMEGHRSGGSQPPCPMGPWVGTQSPSSRKRGGHKGPSGGYKGPKPALSKIYKLGSTNLYLTYGGRLLSTLTCGPYGLHSARRDDTAGRFATTTCVCVCVRVCVCVCLCLCLCVCV